MGNLGPTEIILILLVVVLLFGAKKLPELARGSGRALRIFKAETKGLMDDDQHDQHDQREEPKADPHGRPIGQLGSTTSIPPEQVGTTYPVDEASTRDPRA
jgi:TatA/E family protein of Tat protein translocase